VQARDRIKLLVSALMIVALLAGCGQKAPPTAQGEVEQPAEVTVERIVEQTVKDVVEQTGKTVAQPAQAVAEALQPLPAQAQGQGLELTVYNQNLALVKDRRPLELDEGINEVAFTRVAAQVDPTSVHFRSLTDPDGTVVLEQNYEYDIVGSHKLLQKYLGEEIWLVTEDDTQYSGVLLSGTGDIILQRADGSVTVVKLEAVREFNFPELPEGLITQPTLVWLLEAGQAGDHETELTYLTEGVNWEADYIVVLAQDDASLDLDGWVTLNNQSGATYERAKLKLIAGDIHRVDEGRRAVPDVMYLEKEAMAAPQVEERAFFEYHLYEVQRPVTVRDNQTKQIQFASGTGVPAEKFFVYDGAGGGYWGWGPITDPGYGTASNPKVMVMLEFRNEEEAGLGIPLPKGKVRVYKRDVDGGTEFIGEDAIDHTPKDEALRLYLGDAFDIVGERKQTDFQKPGRRVMEESYEITLRNHKEEDVEVRVVEHMFRWSEWEILRSTDDYVKLDAQTIEFRVPVKADGEVTVEYTVQYRW
jgi:predicted small lipoprotein YifL